MNLIEYEAKNILKLYNIKIQRGILVEKIEESLNAANNIYKITKTKKWIIKAQIHAGGRGKSGGIKIVNNISNIKDEVSKILGKKLVTPQTSKYGEYVDKVIIAEDVYKKNNIKEYYISIFFDRSLCKNIILYSKEGGVNIENVSSDNPEKIFTEIIDPCFGIQSFQIKKIANILDLEEKNIFSKFTDFINSLYKVYINHDSLLIEINPIIKSLNNEFIVVDAKMTIDDNALFRQDKIKFNDDVKYNNTEYKAFKYGLNFIKLNGNVACIVNGAGLAMATMDMIKLSGGNPANFLDIGGAADFIKIKNAFDIILEDNNVKIILINIFGGIVRCDIIAEVIVNIYREKKLLNSNIHVILRLEGTNSKKAKEIIYKNNIPLLMVNSIDESSEMIKKLLI